MSLLGSLLGALSSVANAARTEVEHKSNAYSPVMSEAQTKPQTYPTPNFVPH